MKRISLTLLASATLLAAVPAASAADLLVRQPSMPGYVDMGSGAWDGPYAGFFAGYGWGTTSEDGTEDLLSDDLDLSGWLLGGTLGANFTVAEGFVLGAAGDLAWSGISGYDEDTDLDYDVNWVGSFRGRAGFDAGAFMPYLTAGLAFAGVTANQEGDDNSQIYFGWTAGAGVEVAATDTISVDLQYRYSDYGSATFDIGPDSDLELSTHQITAGVNFKF